MTAGWRECADPVELAAAVAAGVEVQYQAWHQNYYDAADEFAASGLRYRVPASWSWSPGPPAPVTGDELRERIVKVIDDWHNTVEMWTELDDLADAVLAVLPPQPADEGAGPSGPPWYLAQDVWMALGGDSNAFEAWAHHEDDRRTWGDAWAQIIAAVGGSRMEGDTNPPPGTILDLPSYQWVRESPAPSTVPPWVVPPCICKSYNLDGQVEGREEVVLDRPTWMPDGERVNGVPVDECIARVVRFLWDNDVRTWGSCCGHNGRYGPPSLLLDRREDIAWVRALIAEVDPRIWHLDWVRTPSPVPPWPGAVLSGLTDEDGVPTWLAQAGQVRGEQVRDTRGAVWTPCALDDNLHPQAWVEVRAPRAAPEPETERVPWWEAKDRLGLAGDPFVEVGADDEGPWVRVVEGGTKLHSPVDPDGTVEVLRKDGDR